MEGQSQKSGISDWLDNELSLLHKDLAGGKSEKMEFGFEREFYTFVLGVPG